MTIELTKEWERNTVEMRERIKSMKRMKGR
jgi:hypothetical protein